MGAKVLIRLNREGIGQLLKSDDVRYELQKRATAIAEAANAPDLADNYREGYEARSFVGHDRAMAVVRTANRKAREDQALNHTLERSLSAGS